MRWLAVILNIIPELGNLVDVGSYEDYAVNPKDPKRYLALASGGYKSLFRLFQNFQQHLNPETDALQALLAG